MLDAEGLTLRSSDKCSAQLTLSIWVCDQSEGSEISNVTSESLPPST